MSEEKGLPSGWTFKTVGELAAREPNSITDGPFGSKLKTAHYTRNGPRVIRLTNIGDGEFVDAYARVSEDHFSTLTKHCVFAGDIVIAALGERLPRACLIPETVGPAIVKADCIRFRPSEEHSAKFLNYALNWEGTQKRTAAIVHGVGRPRLNLSEVKSILLPIAPPFEQRRIVAEIEKQFTRLDAAVAALRRVQAKIKRYRAAILKAACEGRLVPTDAELVQGGTPESQFETGPALVARVLIERRHQCSKQPSYKEPVPPDIPNLPVLPDSWTWASLDQLFSLLRNGISTKPDAESGLPILRISAVRPLSVKLDEVRYLDAKAANYSAYVLSEGDLLFTRYNGNPDLVGVCGVVPHLTSPLVHPDKIIRCRLVTPGVLPDFVAIMANVGVSRDYLARRVRTTAGQAGISGSDLKGLPIPVAPLTEQSRIVAEVQRRLSVLRELEQTATANLQRAARLRQSILQKAFTGQLI